MQYVVDQSEETFAKFRERYEYKDMGRGGFDLYPKAEFFQGQGFKEVNPNIDPFKLHSYMVQSDM